MLTTTVELFLIFIVFVILGYYAYYSYCFGYWKRKGVPQLKPTFPVGDLGSSALGKESVFVRLESVYNTFKKAGHKFGGIYFFNGPVFFPVHPDFVKRVLVSNFDHFSDRGMYINTEKVPLSSNMFTMYTEEWKKIRSKLTPTFTSGKLKSMYKIFVHVSQNLAKTLEPFGRREAEVDMKKFLMRYTADIIGSTAFGVECNSLKDPETEMTQMINKVFDTKPWMLFKVMLEEGLQNPGNINKIFMDNQVVQKYFMGLVEKTVEYRDKNNINRNDFMQLLMQQRDNGMTLQEIMSQAFLFFVAGFETSSTVMSFCIHELTHNEEIQEKLRAEIWEKLGRDSSTYSYEDIPTLPYLDKCVKETMRKYPVVAVLNRMCAKKFQIPETDIIIEEGTPVIISVLGLHRDPEFYPDPLKFDPERFNNEKDLVPYTFLPFGDGPRNCIGLRFGLLQTKLGLATLLNDFRFYPSPLTPRHIKIETSTTTVVFNVSGGVHVRVVKI